MQQSHINIPPNLESIFPNKPLPSLSSIRKEIVQEFWHCWNAYKRCAWGYDNLHPISCKGTNEGFNMGLTILDSLDTMIIMKINENDKNLQNEINLSINWIANNLHFENVDVSLFETTIRAVGGLLAAFNLTNNIVLLEKAQSLADKLMVAFDTPTGLPFSTVNLQTGKAYNPQWAHGSISTSEAASLQLEYNYLSYLTGDYSYAKKAQKAQNKVIEAMSNSSPQLLRKWISIDNGKFTDNSITFGSRIDSSYEYFLKVPLQLSHSKYVDHIHKTYLSSINIASEHLFQRSKPNNLLFVAQKEFQDLSTQFDHLVCFIGGMLALGSIDGDNPASIQHLQYAEELTQTCASLYFSHPTGLAPEIAFFNQDEHTKSDFHVKSADKFSILRPETVESIFYLYRITHDDKYRKWGYEIFKSFREYTRVESGGYSSINNIMATNKKEVDFRDNMETFFIAETMKYLYLLFCDDNVIDINHYVFNTEAHVLPKIPKNEVEELFKEK